MIDRRSFLNGAAGAAGVAVTAVTSARAQTTTPSAPRGSPDVVVVGAGAFGGWTALSLLEKGANVVSIDEYGPSNPRAASAGGTRAPPSGYGGAGF